MRCTWLLLAALLSACVLPPSAGTGPAPAARTPFMLARGDIRGQITRTGGSPVGIGAAFVTTGSVSAFSADPKDDEVVAEDAANENTDTLSVMHAGELMTRIIRRNPPDPANRYVYLRRGEFFLEGVPEGNATLMASFGNVSSVPSPVTVYKNTIVEDVALTLYLPEPLAKENCCAAPRIVEFVKAERSDDPPTLAVTLKSPPGSPGTVITAAEVDGVLVPLPPTSIPPAQEITYGPAVVVRVPLAGAARSLTFRDDKGVPVPDRDLNALTIKIPPKP